MKDAIRKFLLETLACIIFGFVFGGLGYCLGYGESRTGAVSGVEPTGCLLVTFGLGIYAFCWVRIKPDERAGTKRGLLRAFITLLPVSWMITQATGMVDHRLDPAPDISAPLWIGMALVYGTWGVGICMSAFIYAIYVSFRRARRLFSKRATA